MGVYIRDMKKPDCCYGCWALNDDGDYPRCRITDECRGFTFNTRERVMDECPLIEVKTPHGDLIDRNKLYKGIEENYWYNYFDEIDVRMIVNDASAIIDAEYND